VIDYAQLYRTMVLIRTFEERFYKEMRKGQLHGTGHLYAGEEAVAAGVCAHLTDQDYITSTHRGHGHCIAKGVDVRGMMAELYGRATGVCKGKGGSMHIADMHKGMLGANGVVGAGLPLACGAGLTAKLTSPGAVAVSFFGDGGANIGAFHESLNLASIWKLPVVFVCENNRYAESTPVEYACSVADIADRARGYNMPGVVVDGQDVLAVHAAAGEAVERARRGEGPALIEAKTYRYYGHYFGDPEQRYRTREEVESYKAKDCIQRFRDQALGAGWLTDQQLATHESETEQLVDDAVAFAESSPWPELSELTTDVYTPSGGHALTGTTA
jgi:acetoin:2,6-dichlorophenolindophenol oxidoreductase subunit alpha